MLESIAPTPRKKQNPTQQHCVQDLPMMAFFAQIIKPNLTTENTEI